MACFPRGELLRQPLPSFTSLRRRYFLTSRRSSHDAAASMLPVVAAPVSPGCRDLLHSALVSGRLCQVRAARHGSFPDSVLEQLTGNPPCLGIKQQRVVKVATDAWLATAGLRGGQILEARFSTFAASHTPLPSASADPQGSELRDGLGSSVVSPCYAVSGGIEKYLPILSSQHRVSFHPLVTQGRDCVTNASRRCGVPATGCCGTGQSGLSGPVALGPGVRALVSGQSSSPLFPPEQCA